MRCTKMQRSLNECENVQFVQELAEVDGPFESPININFRDLTKLELPSLVWNRSECVPKKMKITNTGHTVIVSGKWKTERPYLTGGPLVGKYVFSQIHFHWGQENCAGSEHKVCGESFPLEMHVAHFKTDYSTQECALREKDGMVVVVYLFKLQEEPNLGLRKILKLLPAVKQATTSQAMHPGPILSLCNPFTDDYFMYWGSVVTTTCAHILLWIICREPFGISAEQVNEFRKICDSSQQPICRNSRQIQPLHCRNVFHVNASKNLTEPMLPIKKIMGCYCKGSGENINVKSSTNDCCCQLQMQEDIEGTNVEFKTGYRNLQIGGKQALIWKKGLSRNFVHHQPIFVQSTLVQSGPIIPLLPKKFNSETVGLFPKNYEDLKHIKSGENAATNIVSHSCCFFPMTEISKIDCQQETRKFQNKKQSFNSNKAMSNIMDSLEALKNQTFKKLKEIDSINQEIKGFKSFCQNSEDKKWLRNIEKIMYRQKRSTIRSSQSCLCELKKLARECNFDRYFDNKFSMGDNNNKFVWFNSNFISPNDGVSPRSDVCYINNHPSSEIDKALVKPLNLTNAIKFSTKAQKIIQSFFEDIKGSEELHLNVQKNLQLKKLGSSDRKQTDNSLSLASITKGLITQKMFALENLGDRLFAEVKTEDMEIKNNGWGDKRSDELDYSRKIHSEKLENADKEISHVYMPEKQTDKRLFFNTEEIIPLHRANVAIRFTPKKQSETKEAFFRNKLSYLSEKFNDSSHIKIPINSEATSDSTEIPKLYMTPKKLKLTQRKKPYDFDLKKIIHKIDPNDLMVDFQYSSSSLSTDSVKTQKIIIAKVHKKQSKKEIRKKKSSIFAKVLLKKPYDIRNSKKRKVNYKRFEGYYVKKKNTKNRKEKSRKSRKIKDWTTSCEFCSSSGEETTSMTSKSVRKNWKKNKIKVEIVKTSDSNTDSTIEYSLTNSKRRKLKIKYKKLKQNILKANLLESLTDSDTQTININKSKTLDLKKHQISNRSPKLEKEIDDNNEVILKKPSIEEFHNPKTESRIQKNEFETKIENSSRAFAVQTFIKSSSDSNSNSSEKSESNKQEDNNTFLLPIAKNTINLHVTSHDLQKIPLKKSHNKSLTNLQEKVKLHSIKMPQRIFVENLDDRMKSANETSELIKKLHTPNSFEKIPKTTEMTDESRNVSTETNWKNDGDNERNESSYKIEEKQEVQEQKVQEYNVRFFTTSSHLLTDVTKTKQEKQQTSSARRDVEKHILPQKELEKAVTTPQERVIEFSEALQADFSREKENLTVTENKNLSKAESQDLQTSLSSNRLEKAQKSRPYSAETLTPQMKSSKRKSKKRPNCCKRNSRHYIRRNSSILKKSNKIDSKPGNFLGMTEEEQIKVISLNIVKYLKQQLGENKSQPEPEKKYSSKTIKKVILKPEVEKNLNENQKKVATNENKTKLKTDPIKITKSNENVEKGKVTKTKKPTVKDVKKVNEPCEVIVENKLPSTPSKPVHNFIKLNKKLAGKYKRLSSPIEKNGDTISENNDETKKETSVQKQKTKILIKKKDSSPKAVKEPKVELKDPLQTASPPITYKPPQFKSPKIAPSKNTGIPKKLNFETVKTNKKPITSNMKDSKKQTKTEDAKKILPTSLALQKMPPPKNRSVPSYMVTSYLKPPVEVVEKQQRKINKYLLDTNNSNPKSYLPDVIWDQKKLDRKYDSNKIEPSLANDFKYLYRLHSCLNTQFTAKIENPMSFVKTFLNQEYKSSALVETTPANETSEPSDANLKGIVLIKMNELPECSSNSDFEDEFERFGFQVSKKDSGDGNHKLNKIPEISNPKEYGDSEFFSSPLIGELDGFNDHNSDSSYNCEISITLNTNKTEPDGDVHMFDPISCLGELTSSQLCNLENESTTSLTTTLLQEDNSAQSFILRPHKKKRKISEISGEMKQKLLEILEGEIKREMALCYGISPDTSSDGLALTWDESDGIYRSQSTDSSCDNLEVMAEISETMKQYLKNFKESRRLAQELDETKASKNIENDSEDEC